MGQRNTDIIKKAIFKKFPGLETDKEFKITSPENTIYNCIAWAYLLNNCWMWPDASASEQPLDGVIYWPDKTITNTEVSNFINAFKLKGYEICNNEEYEKGFQKIALYVEPGTTKCTHASRQLIEGGWTSKLGPLCDIKHGSPHTIEGDEYGVVYCIMKRDFD